jgi:hypothetical protein
MSLSIYCFKHSLGYLQHHSQARDEGNPQPGRRRNNDTGSQSTNLVLLDALFCIGLPVSGKNLFQ